jgi:hypothetical protein
MYLEQQKRLNMVEQGPCSASQNAQQGRDARAKPCHSAKQRNSATAQSAASGAQRRGGSALDYTIDWLTKIKDCHVVCNLSYVFAAQVCFNSKFNSKFDLI